MKAVKTPSGKWRVRPVDHYEIVNGKRRAVLASITRDTKQEAMLAAYAYKDNKEQERARGVTVAAAIERYLTVKKAVLSPSTYRAYLGLQKHAYGSIDGIALSELTSELLQAWVSEYSVKHSPKSVANAHGLLQAVLTMFRPDARFSVKLPQRNPPKLYTPTDADIKVLLEHVKGTDLEKAVMLSAFGTFRRGEICALTAGDFTEDSVTISKSLIKGTDNKWVLKAPKTPDSVRTVKLPRKVIERVCDGLDASERIISVTPSQISDQFAAAVRACGLPHFRFHDLRAYAVSIRHALGIPDVYIMRDGGYRTDAVMKQVYRRAMTDKADEFAQIAIDHFDGMVE